MTFQHKCKKTKDTTGSYGSHLWMFNDTLLSFVLGVFKSGVDLTDGRVTLRLWERLAFFVMSSMLVSGVSWEVTGVNSLFVFSNNWLCLYSIRPAFSLSACNKNNNRETVHCSLSYLHAAVNVIESTQAPKLLATPSKTYRVINLSQPVQSISLKDVKCWRNAIM